MILEDAAPAEIPPLLLRPPWLDIAPPPPLPVIEKLSPLPVKTGARMSDKDRARYRKPPQSLSDLRGYNLVPKHLEPQTPEMDAFVLARLQKPVRYGASYLDLLTEPAARAYLEQHGLQNLHTDLDDIRHIVAVLGDWTIPLLERDPDASPALRGCVESTSQAKDSVEEAIRGPEWDRQKAIEYLRRYPEVAASVLLPRALARTTQKRAIELLQTLAGEHPAVVEEVARRYGAAVLAALPALLAYKGPPRKLPLLPDWTDPLSLPPVEVAAAPGKRLPEGPTRHLIRFVAMDAGGEWPEAEAWIRDVRGSFTKESLATFAWALFRAWSAAGAKPSGDFVMHGLSWFGDDKAARRLAARIRIWIADLADARAGKGIDALAAMGTDAALAQVDALATRAGDLEIEERASKALDEVAARRGLSRDELDDRLAPTLGLDRDGSRLLSSGERSFVVGVDESLVPYVLDDNGERLTDLPAQGRSNDPALADAVRAWWVLKRDVPRFEARQSRRLEAAMIYGRRWAGGDFLDRVVGHPLLVHLARRLVWAVFSKDQPPATFRIAEDRSLSGPDGRSFALKGDEVGVIHRLDLTDAEAARWKAFFREQRIIQPFAQLDRDVYVVTKEEAKGIYLGRFAGQEVTTTALLGLSSRGWVAHVDKEGSIRELRRILPGDLRVRLPFEDGYSAASPDDSPSTQTLSPVELHRGTWTGPEPPLGSLPPAVFSELVRDVASLKPRRS